ncbi:alpha/beta hydrolase [Phenylobacterium sp. LjRoot225]|uniref:alpha/beta hydrolase n=1 Tax=Phenylobacterium sp. LjRoot225 TaxID=3342285 RepID=UPI003ECD8677
MSRMTRRGFGLLAGAGTLAITSGAAGAAVRAPAAGAFDPTPYVNPELRPMLDRIRKFASAPLNAQTLPAQRKATFSRPPLAQPAWVEQMIPGPAGAPAVRVYVINAAAGRPQRPAILHTHGGGFVLGAAKADIRNLQEIALALDCVIVTVDYRLAPETRFPGPLEDNYAGLKWLHANAAALGVDRTRIAVMGESAGGGHAAMLAIAARDRGEIPLVYQALIYPMLDDRTGSTRKTPPYIGALIWTPERNRFGWTSLLGVPAGSARVPHGSVPARVKDLRGLPPAFIGVGSIDLFVDEDIEYARRLVDAGIQTELNVVPGAFHGFDAIGNTAIARQFKAALINGLSQALRPTGR